LGFARRRRLFSQIMRSLPEERLKPSPAFYFSAVDLFGPFTIRDSVKKRTHGKAYGVIFTCLLFLTESLIVKGPNKSTAEK
jgi:hypothetical protein